MLRIGVSGLLRIWDKIYRCVVNIVEGTVGWNGKSVCASRKKPIRAHYCQQDFWHSWGGQSFGCAGLNLHRTRSHLIFGVGVNYTLVTLKSEIITSSSSCSTVYRRFSNMTLYDIKNNKPSFVHGHIFQNCQAGLRRTVFSETHLLYTLRTLPLAAKKSVTVSTRSVFGSYLLQQHIASIQIGG